MNLKLQLPCTPLSAKQLKQFSMQSFLNQLNSYTQHSINFSPHLITLVQPKFHPKLDSQIQKLQRGKNKNIENCLLRFINKCLFLIIQFPWPITYTRDFFHVSNHVLITFSLFSQSGVVNVILAGEASTHLYYLDLNY